MAVMAVCSYAQDIITEAPRGAEKSYVRTGKTYDSENGRFVDFQDTIQVVTTTENDVYIQNPISSMPFGTWIKGHQEGNTITVPTHQHLYSMTGLAEFYVDMFELRNGKYILTADKDFTFTVEGDKLILNGTNADGSRILGCSGTYQEGELAFASFGDCDVVCTFLEESGIPVDAVARTYTVTASRFDLMELGHKKVDTGSATVYVSGNKVFFEGFFPEMPGAVIKGTKGADGNVTFSKDQVAASFFGLNLYVTGCTTEMQDAADMTDLTDVVFAYDEAADTYTLQTPSIVINGSNTTPDPLSFYTELVLANDVAAGISAPASAAQGNAAVTYYDLTGKRLAQPTKGIVIKKVQQADGTTKTVKMVVK